MEKFTRAVTEEQKQVRKQEIRRAAEQQLSEQPMFEISMTSIAKSLNWTRSNLYKYYTNVSEIIADIWADKFTDMCREFNDRLRSMVRCTPESYAELAHHMYFGRSDVMKYITLQPILTEDEGSVKIMMAVRPLYRRWVSEHIELLMKRFDIDRRQAESIYLEGYHTALGLYNVENMEMHMVPDLADRYADYMRLRFVKAMTISVRQAIKYSRNPELDPLNEVKDVIETGVSGKDKLKSGE